MAVSNISVNSNQGTKGATSSCTLSLGESREGSPTSTPEAIRIAKALLDGKIPTAEGFELDTDLRNIDEMWPTYLFSPEEEVINTSESVAVNLLAKNLRLDVSEEDAVTTSEPSPLRSNVVARIYEAAAKEAARALFTLAKESEPQQFGNCRLRARLCVAIREELTELLREWACSGSTNVEPEHHSAEMAAESGSLLPV